MRRVAAAIIAIMVSAPAMAQHDPSRAGKAPSAQALIAESERANDRCRGGSGDDPKPLAACNKRDALNRRIDRLGFCYGREGQHGHQMRWHKCGPDSLKPPAD